MTPTSTLQLACPTYDDEIEVEYEIRENGNATVVGDDTLEIYYDSWADPVSLRTWCFHAISKEKAYELLMDYAARQAELATERAGERP